MKLKNMPLSALFSRCNASGLHVTLTITPTAEFESVAMTMETITPSMLPINTAWIMSDELALHSFWDNTYDAFGCLQFALDQAAYSPNPFRVGDIAEIIVNSEDGGIMYFAITKH